VSEGEFQGVKGIMTWAKRKRIRPPNRSIDFVDNGLSIEWMKNTRNCSKFINQRIFESFNSSVKKP
jgi:hypothetical protein